MSGTPLVELRAQVVVKLRRIAFTDGSFPSKLAALRARFEALGITEPQGLAEGYRSLVETGDIETIDDERSRLRR